VVVQWIEKIAGKNYFITPLEEFQSRFGKVNPEHLPSPLLSMLRNDAPSFTLPQKQKMRVLIPTGFLFRFPMIYNSALRLDTLNKWVVIIENVIREITSAGYDVDIKMYNEITAEVWGEVLNRWISAGGGKAHNFRFHDSSVRELIRSGKVRENYDAIIWDVPTGGLTESFAAKVPVFGIWNDEIVTATKTGRRTIDLLHARGVLATSGFGIVSAINLFYKESEFRREYFDAIDLFLSEYCRVDQNWGETWLSYFNTLENGEV
jgi:hypothetical protein